MVLKKIAFFIIIVVFAIIINNLAHSTFELWQKKDLLIRAQQELNKEKKEQQALRSKLAQVKKQQFVEEEARNKLFLGKKGEQVVFIPTQQSQASPSAKEKSIDMRPNWRKWWDTFFTTTP